MATRTTYTATVSVPVYASWKCENCGEINFSTGVIKCEREETTTAIFREGLDKAKQEAINCARSEWVEDAYKLIIDPNQNGNAMYENFFLEDTKCKNCGKKPKWNKNLKHLGLFKVSLPLTLISGMAAFSIGSFFWVIFLALLAYIVWCIVKPIIFSKMMENYSKEYTPVIGSFNQELIDFAKDYGVKIPTPEGCVKMLSRYTYGKDFSDEMIRSVIGKYKFEEKTDLVDDAVPAQIRFCRNCGTQLQGEVGYCHKCGTKEIV